MLNSQYIEPSLYQKTHNYFPKHLQHFKITNEISLISKWEKNLTRSHLEISQRQRANTPGKILLPNDLSNHIPMHNTRYCYGFNYYNYHCCYQYHYDYHRRGISTLVGVAENHRSSCVIFLLHTPTTEQARKSVLFTLEECSVHP